MAEIRPFRAFRYNRNLVHQLESLTSPLFDVVSDRQREHLYQNPLNSLHISVPQQPFAADRAALILNEWKEKKVLVQDKLPAIYAYYQYFTLPGSKEELCRKGFICNIRVYPWEENMIQRHENTIPKSVNDRIEILEKTELHVSPTHGLYTDTDFQLEKIMDEAMKNPLLETEDYQGVRDVLAVIHDAPAIQKFIDLLRTKRVVLADGHHRYEGSLAHLRNQKRANPTHSGNEGYNFQMMYLTNTEGGDLKILPTHRLIAGLNNLNHDKLLEKLEADFSIKEVDEATTLNEIISGKQWTYGLILKDKSFVLKLRPGKINKLFWPFPAVVKELDLTVMHYFIIQKALGIPGKEQRKSDHISFERNFSDCLEQVKSGQKQLAIIVNEVSIEDVKKVCESGYTMPQKSTYFFPKIVTGFVFSSIKETEFKSSPYSPF